MDDIKAELEEMENDNIITKVKEGEPTAWLNSLGPVVQSWIKLILGLCKF